MAVIENNPVTCLETILDLGHSGALHFFSHGSFLGGVFLVLSSIVINGSSRIGTSGQEIKHRSIGHRLGVDISNLIINGLSIHGVQNFRDELVGSDLRSVFTEASAKDEIQEGSKS